MSSPAIDVSFEFFPPGDEAMEATLWESIQRLEPLQPRFVSVTYGADGSTRERTHNVVIAHPERDRAHRRAAPDLHRRERAAKCSTSRARYWDQGIRHIVALRGDAPRGHREVRAACRWLRLCRRSGQRA